ncbi:putative F-box/FBD/LRR-repeat protein At4g00315 [Carex rostrata]
MWICHALRCNPRELEIVYSGSSKLHMAQSIFTCASLEYLGFQLVSDEGLEFVIPKIINLPRLRSLWVGRVALGEEFIHTFFSACPILEVLDLLECDIGFSDIYSQKLQSLIIERCYVKKMLCISTPNLDYLEICFRKETVAKGVVLQEMGSLYEADFSFELDIANIPREFVLLSKISNVTSLRLGGSGVVLKALLEKEVPNCSTFHNLTYLYIDGLCIIDDFDLVARFFCLLPNLEDLVLRNAAKKIATGEGRGDLARGTLKSKCLKTVEIQCPEGSNVRQLERVLLASIEDPYRVRIILSSY